jgi:HPt (histidine-containing phosphotransfer) domain-containing protein
LNTEPVDYDQHFLSEQLGGDEEAVQEILTLFLDNVPLLIDEIREALEKGDAPLVKGRAHSLKGASGNVGALKLQHQSLMMEKIGANGDLSRGGEILEKIQNSYRIFKETVSRLVK